MFSRTTLTLFVLLMTPMSLAAEKSDDAKLDRPRIMTQVGHNTRVGGLAISPDGKLIVTVGTDGRVFLWDSATGRQLRELTVPDSGETTGEQKPPKAVGFSPDSSFVSANGNIWNAVTGQYLCGGKEGEFTRDSKGIIYDGSRLNWVKKEVPARPARNQRLQRTRMHLPNRRSLQRKMVPKKRRERMRRSNIAMNSKLFASLHPMLSASHNRPMKNGSRSAATTAGSTFPMQLAASG